MPGCDLSVPMEQKSSVILKRFVDRLADTLMIIACTL